MICQESVECKIPRKVYIGMLPLRLWNILEGMFLGLLPKESLGELLPKKVSWLIAKRKFLGTFPNIGLNVN